MAPPAGTQIPALSIAPRRFESPFNGLTAAVLEPIHQPLYSATVLATSVANENNAFQYARGGGVAGATTTTATALHTNMEGAGQLPSPKMFMVTGVRLIPGAMAAALDVVLGNDESKLTGYQTIATNGTAADAEDALDDLKRILYGSYFRFYVGTKDYLQVPSFLVPGNTGIDGEASQSMVGGPTSAIVLHKNQALHSVGRYFGFDYFPIVIPPQQNFFTGINFPQATRPTLSASRIVWHVLDGIYGREV